MQKKCKELVVCLQKKEERTREERMQKSSNEISTSMYLKKEARYREESRKEKLQKTRQESS